jgi:tRNA-Thr(GGU) m(6)t(6)A37 methyltransferase TsaA
VTGVTSYAVTPIGWVHSSRDEAIDDDWESVGATITLDPARFGAESLAGLAEFSHVEVVYLFDRVDDGEVQVGARHPRGNADWPSVGIFAQRAKMRPNRLGVTVCRLVGIDDITLTVEALDAIDGTPVLDVKPVMAEFLPRGELRQPEWSRELMATYWSRS